jgi:hypothetical protein
LAEQVGIDGAPGQGDADLALRCAGAGECHPVLDLCFDEDSVVLTIAAKPSQEVWLMIRELLDTLG